MNNEMIVRLLPLAVFLGVMGWIVLRSRRSCILQEDSMARQKEMAPRLLESIEMQKEALQVAHKQLEAAAMLLEEIRALRGDLKK